MYWARRKLLLLNTWSNSSTLNRCFALYTLTGLPIVVTMFKCLIWCYCAYLHVRDQFNYTTNSSFTDESLLIIFSC